MYDHFGSWFHAVSLVILLQLDILGLECKGYLQCARVHGFIASLGIVELFLSGRSFFFLRSMMGTVSTEGVATEKVSQCLDLTN